METYSINNFSFTYPNMDYPALREINFTIENGQFICLCGQSGCGKTTLLRQLKSILAPHGISSGQVLFNGKQIQEISWQQQAAQIGFVQQSPDFQIVTDKVWHELAFGLENLSVDNTTIRLRVAEMAAFFGIESWFRKDINQLSGGQKQLLNLAAIMTMQPSILLLDEPTSQLDPIAAQDFLETLVKINREMGTTILISEHRLEEVLPICDRMIMLDQGQLIIDAPPRKAALELREKSHKMFCAMPTGVRIWAGVDNNFDCPLTVRESRNWLDQINKHAPLDPSLIKPEINISTPNEDAFKLDQISFGYQQDAPLVLDNLTLNIQQGEFFALVGGNGSGKSTLLSLIGQLNKPLRGKLTINDNAKFKSDQNIAMLPQKPQTLFIKNTLLEDLYEVFENINVSVEVQKIKIEAVSRLCELEHLWNSHPFDLSGGEQQRAALAKILLLAPQILLLDEPTKGLDSFYKQKFARILFELQTHGITILMVSHDIEFCAKYANRCGLLFDGSIVALDNTRPFFAGQYFYTTAANRIGRKYLPKAILAEDIINACGDDNLPDDDKPYPENDDIKKIYLQPSSDSSNSTNNNKIKKERQQKPPLSKIRMYFGISLIVLFCITAFIGYDCWSDWREYLYQGVLILEIVLALIAFYPGLLLSNRIIHTPAQNAEVSRVPLWRKTLIYLVVLLAIPLTIWLGNAFLDERQYYITSLLVIIEAMIPFILLFESRKPQARELVMIAVIIAVAVAGRAVLFMVPQFKPVLAIIIISGICLGRETGFLVGAMTALISNFLFGQGPWTPWQMFTFGLIGFIAGAIFHRGFISTYKSILLVFGAIATFIIFGGIMNLSSLLLFSPQPSWEMFLTVYGLGLPFDIPHTIATVVFLWLAAEPLIGKIERVKLKYGILN